jgi:hypothetical protein
MTNEWIKYREWHEGNYVYRYMVGDDGFVKVEAVFKAQPRGGPGACPESVSYFPDRNYIKYTHGCFDTYGSIWRNVWTSEDKSIVESVKKMMESVNGPEDVNRILSYVRELARGKETRICFPSSVHPCE